LSVGDVGVVRLVVEGDTKSDLDVPAGDADLVDDEADQLLALIEVGPVESGIGSFGERADALTEPVVLGEPAAWTPSWRTGPRPPATS
jgi:hypothetical protein